MNLIDVIVIGGGPGGYLAAQRTAEGGKSVILFERNNLGGTCLNEGCIPTKTLLNSVKIYEHAKHGEKFGVVASDIKINHAQVIDRKDKVVKTLVGGVGMTMKRRKVKVVKETAKVLKKTEEGFVVEAGGEKYLADKLIIATGSEVLIPPIEGVVEALASGKAVTSREILQDKSVPESLVVAGAGVVGLEFASYFATLGVKVFVVEMMNKIAGPADDEIAKLMKKELEKQGIEFLLGCKVTKFNETGLLYEKDGEEHQLDADKILLSIGRRSVSTGVGLENLDVEIDRGSVVTNQYLETSVKGLYAVGDVNGKAMLAHTAYREAEVAAKHILGVADEMKYDMIPSVIYTIPEMVGVGETEQSAKEKGLNVKIGKLPMVYAGRFVAENEDTTGICKLIMDNDTRKLVGVQIAGPYAAEMIWGVAGLMEQGVTVDEMKKIVYPHPTVSEIIKETLFTL